MSTPNKYHSSGREYTATELAERRRAATPVYLVLNGQRVRDKPYNVGRNAAKKAARLMGWRSLKQRDRVNERAAIF